MPEEPTSRCYSVTLEVWVDEGTYFPEHIEAMMADTAFDDEQTRMVFYLVDAAEALGCEVVNMTSTQVDATNNVIAMMTDPEGAA